MQNKIYSAVTILLLIFTPLFAYLQQYKVPATYNFDYQVVQHYKNPKRKNSPDQIINYYYSKTGDYTAIKTPNKNAMVIFTKDGTMVTIDNDKKGIIILRLQNLASGMGKMQGAPANSATGASHDGSAKYSSVKTGNTKQICGYPANEYIVTNDKGEKAHVWYAIVEFNAQLLYTLANASPGAGAKSSGMIQNPYLKSLNNPKAMVVEIDPDNQQEGSLSTESITRAPTAIATSGYSVMDMSSMNLKDLMQQHGGQ